MKRLLSLFILLSVVLLAGAQTRSAKRGVGWDERGQKISDAPIDKMLPGVSWFYNWGASVQGTAANLGTADGMAFAPMCWNGGYDANAIRNYVNAHKGGVKYLLGFNEPNFSAQSNMTPSVAAEKWQGVEALAEELGLKLVAPALNFTGENVGGRTWNPYEWLDEFIKQYKQKNGRLPKIDCLALHCYMNWYGSHTWFATEYFYKDLYDSKKDCYGKYPNIVAYFDAFKTENGHFPKMMLTEFCSWEGNKDGFVTTKESQIDQMTQKVQKMEQSDLVEGYAWFMGNAGGGYNEFPYMSLFQTNTPGSELSDLGKVYVNMSSFDKTKYYAPGELIQAKDYIDATTDNQQAKLRVNTEEGSNLPLQVVMQNGAWTKYQINVPADGDYKFTLHVKSSTDMKPWLYVDGGTAHTKATITSTANAWEDREFTAKSLKAGNHSIMLYNSSTSEFLFNSFSFSCTSTGIVDAATVEAKAGNIEVYNINGTHVGSAKTLSELSLAKGVYVIVMPSGVAKKTVIE